MHASKSIERYSGKVNLVFITSAILMASLSYSSAAYSDCAPDNRSTSVPYINETITCTGTDVNGWGHSGSWVTLIIYPDGVTGPINIGNWNGTGSPIGGGGNEIYNYGTARSLQVGPDSYIENHGVTEQITGYAWSTLINEVGGSVTNANSHDAGIFGSSLVYTNEGNPVYYGSDVINRGSISMTGATATSAIRLERNSLGINESTGSILTTGDDSAGMMGLEAAELHNQGSIEVQGALSDGMYVVGDAIMENSGTIIATGEGSGGIDLIGRVGQITNSGSISVAGTENYGISALYIPYSITGATTLSVANNGTIQAMGLTTYGISVEGYDGAVINNSASVEVNGHKGQGISVGGTASMINNAKTGSVTVNGDSAYAIAMGGSGHVTNSGRILAGGVEAIGIAAEGDDVTIDNGGSVEVTEISSIGIGVRGDRATINNDGTVTTQSSGSMGIGVQGSGCSGSSVNCIITNSGAIVTRGGFSDAVVGAGNDLSISNKGSIGTWGYGSNGISLGSEIFGASDSGTAGNEGTIETFGVSSYGIRAVGQDHNVINSKSGTISTAQENSHGIVLGLADDVLPSSGHITNLGNIETTGLGADGIHINSTNAIVDSLGSITTVMDKAAGIRFTGDNGKVDTSISPITGLRSDIKTGGDNADAINVTGDNAVFTGNGSMLTVGNHSNAVHITGTQAKLALGVGGEIKTEGDSSSGIRITGDDAFVFNASNIETGVGTTTLGSQSHGIFVEGDRVSTADLVQNSGIIQTNGPVAHGIYIIGDGHNIVNTGEIRTKGAASNGLQVSGDANNIFNSGLIQAEGIASFGVNLDTRSGGQAVLTNSGTIAATRSTFAVVGGEGQDVVLNSGTISGNVELRGGDDVFVITKGNQINGTVDGGVDYEDKLITASFDQEWSAYNVNGDKYKGFETYEHRSGVVDIYGTLDVNDVYINDGFSNLYGTIAANDSVAINSNMDILSTGLLRSTLVDINQYGNLSIFDGNVQVDQLFVNTGGVLDGKGYVEGDVIANGGVIDPGHSPGTLSINGDLIINDGLLNIEIGGLGAGMIDLLDVSGDASIFGGIINFSFIDGYMPQEGELFEFLVADNLYGFDDFSYQFTGLPTGFDFDLTSTMGGLGFVTTAVAYDSVPEPATIWLLGFGLISLITITGKKKSAFSLETSSHWR